MRFHKQVAQLAVLALILVHPALSHAAPKAQLQAGMPDLTVESANVAGQTILVIRNIGDAASGTFHVRIQLSTGAVYYAALPAFQPGDEMQAQLPAARDGKPFTVEVEVDCFHEITESDETDNLASMRYLS
jgi:hypothetical protein